MFTFYVYSDQPATKLAHLLFHLERRIVQVDGENPVLISVPAREDQYGEYQRLTESYGFSTKPREGSQAHERDERKKGRKAVQDIPGVDKGADGVPSTS